MTRDERPPGYIDKMLFVDDGTLQTFDQQPVYDPGVYDHTVYHAAPELFEMPVNHLHLADGSVLLPRLANRRLRILNPSFFNRLAGAKREEVAVAAYMFDTPNNAIIALGTDGIQYVIDPRYYGVIEAQHAQAAETIKIRATNSDGSLFVLFDVGEPRPFDPADAGYFAPEVDTDTVHTVVSIGKGMEGIQGAKQRHADYYMNILMLADPRRHEHLLDLEMGQIRQAHHRLVSEEVASLFPTGFIEEKYQAAVHNFSHMRLSQLLQATRITKEDAKSIKTVIEMVEAGEVESSANVEALKKRFSELKRASLITDSLGK